MASFANDFERLMGSAVRIMHELENETDDTHDVITILAMVMAFLINTHRQKDVPLKQAQEAIFNMVREISRLGEDVKVQ